MKRKQLLSAALAMVLGISTLAGCSDKKETNNDAPADNKANEESKADGDSADGLPAMTTDNITLTYMHFDNEELVNSVAEAFMEAYPNITVKTEAYAADGEYNNTLLNLVQSGQTPDCMMILGNCDFALSNAILGDMTEYWENDPENENILPTINSAKLGYYGTDKKLATPIKFFPDAIYCDLNVLETLNLEAPSTSWSWVWQHLFSNL